MSKFDRKKQYDKNQKQSKGGGKGKSNGNTGYAQQSHTTNLESLIKAPVLKFSDISQRAVVDTLIQLRNERRGKNRIIDEKAREKFLKKLVKRDAKQIKAAAQAFLTSTDAANDNSKALKGVEKIAGGKEWKTGTQIRVYIASKKDPGNKKLVVLKKTRGDTDSMKEIFDFAKNKLKIKKVKSVVVSTNPDVAITSTVGVSDDCLLLATDEDLPTGASTTTIEVKEKEKKSKKEKKEKKKKDSNDDKEDEENQNDSDSDEEFDPVAAARAVYTQNIKRSTYTRTQQQIDDQSKSLLEYSKKKLPLTDKRQTLPAFNSRQEFIDLLEANQVLVVIGQTGCGKTTQLPQFVLEHAITNNAGGGVNIVCTQPRRIAAVSVAERVAQERDEKIGSTIGYTVRLDSCTSKNTRLTFCTLGVVLQKLSGDPLLSDVTHILVDEVHERSLQTDFLLILLRELLPKRKDLKVILMSATADANLFVDYFSKSTVGNIQIPGRTFPVENKYLSDVAQKVGNAIRIPGLSQKDMLKNCKYDNVDDFLDDCESVLDSEDPEQTKPLKVLEPVRLTPRVEDQTDYKILAHLVKAILDDKSDAGAVLVFLPGSREIDDALKEIKKVISGDSSNNVNIGFGSRNRNASTNKSSIEHVFLPLHGGLPVDQQRKVFEKVKAPSRKIICATNVAETSLTIDDVTHVIDLGHLKEEAEARAHQHHHLSMVIKGTCWKLYHKEFLDALPAQTACEMRRLPLEELVLQCHLLDLPCSLLLQAPEPPKPEAIKVARGVLMRLGALDSQERLTPLGYHLGRLPVDPRVGKLLLYGVLLRCLDSVLTIAAFLSHKSPFQMIILNNNPAYGSHAFKEDMSRKVAKDERTNFVSSIASDHIAWAEIYNAWKKSPQETYDKYKLSWNCMTAVDKLKDSFLSALSNAGFLEHSKMKENYYNKHNDNCNIIRCALVAGLDPSLSQVVAPASGRGRHFPVYSTSDETYRCLFGGSSNLKFGGGYYDLTEGQFALFHAAHLKQPNTNAEPPNDVPIAYLQDATIVNALPLALFCGGFRLSNSRKVISFGKKWQLAVKQTESALLIRNFRNELEQLLIDLLAERRGTGKSDSIENHQEIIMNLLCQVTRHENIAPEHCQR